MNRRDGAQEDFYAITMTRYPGHVIKAIGVAEVAAKAGVGRESLYKVFRDDAQPRFDTISKVAGALGMRVQFVAA